MFNTLEAKAMYTLLKPSFKKALNLLNCLDFEKCKEEIEYLITEFTIKKKNYLMAHDEVLNEFYVLGKFVDMLSSYLELWKNIFKEAFSSSWNSLQDTLDALRTLKRFARLNAEPNLAFFEFQLQELEKLYPYKIFFSIGATVECFECSICRKDIDSLDCPHIKGELYKGEIAYAIACNITGLNHVSMVTHPEDKRCVVNFDDSCEQFKLVRFLSELILSGKLSPLNFGELRFSTRLIRNPEFRKLGRNKPCYCGSGKKFKRCCITNESISEEHVDIVAKPINLNEVIA